VEAASRECASVIEYRIGSQLVRIRVNRKVYMPSVATILLARNLREVKGLDVLDLGTGSGILAILASKLGARRVVATDISRRAISAAIDNARLNGVDNIEFRLGSLYEPVRGEVFDLIICNPPMTPSPKPLPRYTWGGFDGRRVLEPVVKEARFYLRDGGRLLIPVISLIGIGWAYRLMLSSGLKPRAIDYTVHPFGKRLLELKDYLDSLPASEYVYDRLGRPCWRIVLFEAARI